MSLDHPRPRLRRALFCAALFAFAVTLVGAYALRTARRAGDDASQKPDAVARQQQPELAHAAASTQPETEPETKQDAEQDAKPETKQEVKQEATQDAKPAQDAKSAAGTPQEARGAKPAADGGIKIRGVGREAVEEVLTTQSAGPSLRTAPVAATSAAPGEGNVNRLVERGEARKGSARQDEATARTSDSVNRVKNKPREERLTKAKTFNGDLRKLKRRRPVRREKPEREGPPLNPTIRPAGPVAPDTQQPSASVEEVAPSAPAPAPVANFAGLDYNNWGSGHPPDTVGDVGPTYYIQSINSSVGIYNKSDGAQVAAFTLDTFMSQGQFGNLCDTDNFGDPVILYDTFEDRWVITDFAFQLDGGNNVVNPPGAFQCIAVSKTGDPVSGGWNFYSVNTTGGLGDYPKFGIWPDGLYMTVSMFGYASGAAFQNPRVYAFNKAQMYAGTPTVQIVSFDAPSSDFTILPSNARLQTGTPPPGTPNYYVSTWQFLNGVGVYKFHVDWDRISLSTFTGPEVPIAATSWPNASVPNAPSLGGSTLDVLPIRAMMQNQYTNIGGAESLWNTHTVRRANTTGFAAPRWYQLNVTGGTVAPTIPQAATWDPDAANVMHRFMPSLAVDRMGDMALGYSTSSSTTKPAIKYAGRLAADPVNTFSQTEQVLIQGTGTQVGTSRWGDYTAMSLDPDGCTFWYTNEYYILDGFNYQTRIGSFAFPGCVPVGAGGTVSGTVTDGTNPLEGATVALGTRTTTTDASGAYSFEDIPAGTYPSITASLAGYGSSTTTNVVVNDGATTTVNFTLTAAPASACLVDTSQSDFQLGAAANVDLATTPGDVTLLDAANVDQQNTTLGTQGAGFNTVTWLGQTFTPATTGQVTRVDLNLFSLNCAAVTMPNITVAIRNASGNLPTGTDLATATIPGFCNGAGGFFTANFATPVTLVAGTQYALVWRAAAAIPAGAPAPGYFGTVSAATGATAVQNPYAGGRRASSTSSGSTWAGAAGNANNDHGFIVYVKDGFAAAGELVSGVKDANPVAGSVPNWTTLSWTATVPANTSLSFQVAASNNVNGPFNFVGPDGTAATFFTTSGASLAQFKGFRYLKYKALMTTGVGNVTPTLNDVTVCFVNKLTQTINFAPLGDKVYGDADFQVSAAATSGLAVSFAASGDCAVTGDTVHITGAGSCTITASQAGDATHEAAPDVAQTFDITKAVTTTAVTVADATFDGSPHGGTAAVTGPAGLNQSLTVSYAGRNATTYGPSTTAPTNAGDYTASASYAGDSNYQPSSDGEDYTIAKAATTPGISSDINPSATGQLVTFTATVEDSVASADASGTVDFIDTSNANAVICNDVTLTSGQAQCQTSTLAAGVHLVQAVYSGDANFATSSSGLVQQEVNLLLRVLDARAAEPSTGTRQMLFTVVLSGPAGGAGVSVSYATANDTGGANPATAGTDYTSVSTTQLTFQPGETVKVVSVPVLQDGDAGETDETLLLQLSSPSGAVFGRATATGTITQNNTPGTLIISELRTRGPAGDGDEFVELYNNTDSPLTVAATDASAGYGVYKMGAGCDAAPVLVGVVPNGTVIPARGHYLLVGSAYGLGPNASGDLTMTSDIEDDRNVAVFSTASVADISSANRLDAVGFGQNVNAAPVSSAAAPKLRKSQVRMAEAVGGANGLCDLLREGATLPAVTGTTSQHSFFRKECDFVAGIGCTVPGNPKDTNDNAADFLFADTAGSSISGVQQRLGAPGPEGLASPLRRDNAGVLVTLLDSTKSASVAPNRARDLTSNAANNSPFGTLSIRRRVTNTTGGNVTRLRFRIVELTTFPTPGGGQADLRALSSTSVSVSGINDPGTCSPAATPCTLTVGGTTLETPPAQPEGGGYNSTLAAGTVTLAQPMANNTAVNVQFLLGIQTTGTFRFYIIVEALP
ncbi:MAG TPA: Ig-like domain repeat protein [Pyrinomonadaceae bacterium]